jgi:hypothetical protein
MYTLLRIFFFIGFFSIVAEAQYSFITDRRFYSLETLMGYNFKPYQIEIPGEGDPRSIPSGKYSFGISSNNLYVEGPDIQGVYNLNEINTTEYGYFLTTINARDARLRGHLKIILNRRYEVEALIFRRSPDEKEIIFHMAYPPKETAEKEGAFFTDWGEVMVEHQDSLWGKQVQPFFKIHADEGVQQRLQIKDSTYIYFIEEVTIEEKMKVKEEGEKDEKGKKGKKDEKGEEVTEVAEGDDVAEVVLDTIVKVKEIREYFMVVRSILSYDDGTKERKTWRYPIRRVNEKEDEEAGIDDEKYRIELFSPKAEKILVYLSGGRTISSIEIDEKTYLVRGF